MDGEVVEDDVINGFKGRSFDPGVIPIQEDVDAVNVTDESVVDRSLHIPHVGCPTTVLIDGKLQAFYFGQVGKSGCDVQVERERLLTEHMLAGVECCFDSNSSWSWM